MTISARHRLGQVIPLAAMVMAVLLSFVALSIDIGFLYSSQRRMQTAADAAAIAAAKALRNGGTYASASQAAKDIAKLNGFDASANGVTVTAVQPTTSPYNTSGYVQVTVVQPQPTFFLKVLGYRSMNVSAQAISGTANGPGCIYVMDPSRSGSISLTGNFTVSAACGVIVESSDSNALTATGNGSLTATSIGIVGSGPGYLMTGNASISPKPSTKIAPPGDPLASLAPPSVGSCTLHSTTASSYPPVNGNNQVITVPAGVYGGGISITGNNAVVTFGAGTYGNNVSISGNVGSVTFNPGQYQATGSSDSIDIAGNATTTFNAGQYTFCGAVSIKGNNQVTLSPGLYRDGIQITGNATVTFRPGTYVLAGGGLSVTGNSTLTGAGVTFYNTTGPVGYMPISLTGNEQGNFSAPTSGPLEGMLFFQDRSITYSNSNGSSVVGNSSSTFDGVLYFPTTGLAYVGNSGSSGYSVLIADTLTVTGNSSMSLGNNYSSLAHGSPIKGTTLYE